MLFTESLATKAMMTRDHKLKYYNCGSKELQSMKAEELKIFNSTATAVTLSEQRFSLASFRAFSMPSLL